MDSEVSFLALGDWGSANKNQRDVAHQMAKLSNTSTLNSSKNLFVAAMGDNFYDEGVTDVNDPKWKEVFLVMLIMVFNVLGTLYLVIMTGKVMYKHKWNTKEIQDGKWKDYTIQK